MTQGKKWEGNDLSEAIKAIQAGELVAFPTETVYGLGADATNSEAVKKVFKAKGRPLDNPLIVHIATPSDLTPYVLNFPKIAERIMAHFWPGPLTLIFDLIPGTLPPEVTAGGSTCSFRIPKHEATLELIRKSGKPLVGPSANTSGKPSPTTADHVLHDLGERISGVVDGGQTEVGLESTVLDLTVNPPMILRPGAVTPKDLEKIIGEVGLDPHLMNETEKPKSPGMKYKHYAPSVEVKMIDFNRQNWQEAIASARIKNQRIGILSSKMISDALPLAEDVVVFNLSDTGELDQSMHQLFSGLRYLDQVTPKLDIIFIETFKEEELGIAYMNRVRKSANQQYFISGEE